MAKQVPRILRADDFVAEAYEKWAANLPASEKERAAYYLRTAKMFRDLAERVWFASGKKKKWSLLAQRV